MKRRELITLLGGRVIAWPLAARAQQPTMPVIGVLSSQTRETESARIGAVRQGLNETGFFEGRNAAIEYRFADGPGDRGRTRPGHSRCPQARQDHPLTEGHIFRR
jgi:putative tryptophan/tyrosine transport system substrate-binding protein